MSLSESIKPTMSSSSKSRTKAPSTKSDTGASDIKLPSFNPDFIMTIFNEFLACYGDYYDAMLPYTPEYSAGTPIITIIADLFGEGKPLHDMYINYH